MTSLNEPQYKLLLEQLAIPFRDYPLPHQRLLHQLLEKYLLVLATGPEDYGYMEPIDHLINTEDAPLIWEQYHHIPPALCQEVKDLVHNMLQSGIIW